MFYSPKRFWRTHLSLFPSMDSIGLLLKLHWLSHFYYNIYYSLPFLLMPWLNILKSLRLRHFYTNCRRNAELMWGNSRTITFCFTSSKEVYLIFCFVQWAVCNRINEWYDELTYLLNNWWNIGMTNSLTECSTISSRGTKASKANSSNFPSFLTCQSQFRSLRYETQLWFPSINWWKVSLRYLATYHLRISSE